jgi:succinate-semialdehyde dehydrogenase / glutarate-semialdehyde dehydrogenase
MNLLNLPMYIGGHEIDANSVRSVNNPATGEIVGSYAFGSREMARDALIAANLAFGSWSSTPPRERASYLNAIARVMSEHRDELAEIITLENGKPIGESRGEVDASVAHFEWYAEEGTRVYGRTVPPTDPGKRHFVIRQPVGVVACIAPWNFPLMLWARKVAPALAAGCTVVSRSATQTTLSVLKALEYVQGVDLPAGVLNHITGPAGEISDEFLSNPICRKVTFTGSTEVGRTLLERSAANITNLSLELGGQAPAIVCDDADIDLAVDRVFGAKFRNGGRSCIAINRIYVQSNIYNAFIERFTERVERLVVGNGLDPEVGLGPLIDEASVEKYLEHVGDIPGRGGRVVFGGHRLIDGAYAKGFFVEPCVAIDVKDDMQCMCEETFGPLAPIARFTSIEDAIQRANATPFGLSAYLYTTSLYTAFSVGERLEAGTVAVNDDVPSTTIAPFGGVKQSGLGRECGVEGIDAFLETKHLSVRL